VVAHDTLIGHPIISATVTNTNADCTFQNYLCWWSIKWFCRKYLNTDNFGSVYHMDINSQQMEQCMSHYRKSINLENFMRWNIICSWKNSGHNIKFHHLLIFAYTAESYNRDVSKSKTWILQLRVTTKKKPVKLSIQLCHDVHTIQMKCSHICWPTMSCI
jgi:hypothetical protein